MEGDEVSECITVEVSERVCYVAFDGGGPPAFSEHTEYRTAGGLVIDFDAHHRVVGIELLGIHQDCQNVAP